MAQLQVREFVPQYVDRKLNSNKEKAFEQKSFAAKLYHLVHAMRVLHLTFPEEKEYKQLYFRLRGIQDNIVDFDEHYLKDVPAVQSMMTRAAELGKQFVGVFTALDEEIGKEYLSVFNWQLAPVKSV